MKTKEEIKQEARWRFTDGHGATDEYSVDVFINACEWLKATILKFDDTDRANYYEDKIDMLNKLVSPRTEERNALLRKAIKFGNENVFVTKVDEEIRIEEFLKELFMEENGLGEQDMINDNKPTDI